MAKQETNRQFKIEKNVPLPKRAGNQKYPFPDMEVGDSIVGDRNVQKAAYTWGRDHGVRFTARKEGESFRIWRVE